MAPLYERAIRPLHADGMKWIRLVAYPIIFGGGYGWIARSGLNFEAPVWIAVTILGMISGLWVWRRQYPGRSRV
jgi:hypothetical protein